MFFTNLHEMPTAMRAQKTRMANPFMIGEFQFCQFYRSENENVG